LLGQCGVAFAEDLVERLLRPSEGVRDLVPLANEGQNVVFEHGQVGEVGGNQALALKDGEPLFNLVHPRAVDRREVPSETRTPLQPRLDLFAVMDAESSGLFGSGSAG
jgi:hypothetical protein